MKFTDMVRRAEELQMLHTLFRRTLASQAQVKALLDVATEAGETDQITQLTSQNELLSARLSAIGTISHRLIGAYSEDELVAAIDRLGALMEAHAAVRRDQSRIKLEVELAGMRGSLPSDQRLQAEQALHQAKEQLDEIANQVSSLFPTPKILVAL